MQPFGAPADLAGLAPLPRADADAHGLCGGGVVSRAWAVLFSVSSVGKSINSSQFSVLHDCVSGRMSLVMAISDGNIDRFKMIIFIYPIICFFVLTCPHLLIRRKLGSFQ